MTFPGLKEKDVVKAVKEYLQLRGFEVFRRSPAAFADAVAIADAIANVMLKGESP